MKKVIAFGDSILKGICVENGRYRVNELRFTDLVSERLQLVIENRARMGSTITDLDKMMGRAGKFLQDPDYDTVFLEYGGNDSDYDWQAVSDAPDAPHFSGTEPERFAAEYLQKIRLLQDMGKQVYLLSLPPIDPENYFRWITKNRNKEAILSWLQGDVMQLLQRHEMYNLAVFRIGAAADVPVLDISSCFMIRPNYSRLLCEDGIHLNTEAHRLIAETLIGQLKT